MKRLKKFESFSEEHNKVMQSRRDEHDSKQINHMLTNAILFQKLKLSQEIEKLEKEKAHLIEEKDNDRYVIADSNPETNPVLLDYLTKISQIDTAIADINDKISKL